MAGTTRPAQPWNLSIGGDSPAVTPGSAIGDHGLLRVVSNADMVESENADQRAAEEAVRQRNAQREQGLAGHIRERWSYFRSTRETRGISIRLVESLRAYRGQYSEQQLQAIQQFRGSDVYCRLTALKCRGATAMLRDVYLAGERAWAISPTPDPDIPGDINESVNQLLEAEIAYLSERGQPVLESAVARRRDALMDSAKLAAQDKAHKEARQATNYLDDMLVEGGFYEAYVDFLSNLTVFPYAFMKGPVVKMVHRVAWKDGVATEEDRPLMTWECPSPFDVYWDTSTSFETADVVQHIRLSRSDLSRLLGVPGYNDQAIREVLIQYGSGGLHDWLDYTDSARSRLEQKQDPHINQSGLIDTLEFHGNIQGQMLLDTGAFTAEDIPDPVVDYHIIAWLIGQYLIKVQIDPNPRKRHNLYATSFDKVPGADVGHGVPELINDIQAVANATLRALVNNLSIASGPQVMVNDERLVNPQDAETMYPWKRWRVTSDPYGNNEKPVDFFQPQSNSRELLEVFGSMFTLADEVSSIPRYMTGSPSTGTGNAGDTASGLSMLMQNASKTLQSVAANIDADIWNPLLRRLHDVVLLTDDSGHIRGDETIQVKGAVYAAQRERDKARVIEFLQLTANPIDAQIMGTEGRRALLSEVGNTLNLDHKNLVPDPERLAQQTQGAPVMQEDAAQAQGAQAPRPPPEAGNVDEGMRALPRGPSGIAQ